ncbi:MAG: hypothetical protein KatS3mg102_0297 [Planctomycetota bacterium]|nr:MAG: hypothetical protein KatS3mg102_0297 [Planctomycetota bacterium]
MSGPEPFALAWLRELEHGVCAGVRLPGGGAEVPPAVLARLEPAERAAALALGPARRAGWVGGRLAMAAALGHLGVPRQAVGSTARGAPALPPGVVGSISHKERLAVALAARAAGGWRLGVDVEALAPPRPAVARRVLTERERAGLAGLGAAQAWEATVLRFALKEALYKALDPFVERFVGFQEAEVELRPEGGAVVRLWLARGEGPFEVEGRWYRLQGHLLATVRVRACGGGSGCYHGSDER